MGNILDELTDKISKLTFRIEELEKVKLSVPERIPLTEFCRQSNITRPTCYHWAERGLIRMEKIGGRNFVLRDSVSIQSKKYYQKPKNLELKEQAFALKDLGLNDQQIADKLGRSRSTIFYWFQLRNLTPSI